MHTVVAAESHTGQITYNDSVGLFSYFDIHANETQNEFGKKKISGIYF